MMKKDDIPQLQRQLVKAEKRATVAAKALQRKHKGGEWEAYDAAYGDQKRLERELALAKDEEAAIPCEWEPAWNDGAPLLGLRHSRVRVPG